MRKVSFLAIGLLLSACGGGDENQALKTPVAPTATPATPATAEAPKEEAKPKETLAQLQEKNGKIFVEAMNAHDAKKLASLYAEAGTMKVMGSPMESTGPAAIEKQFGMLFAAFPDFKTVPTRVWVKGDVVAVEWVMNGTHQGELMGIKATEKKVGFQGIDIMAYTPEGMIKEHRTYHDFGTILSQIGLSKQKARAIPALPSAPPQMFASTGSADETKNADALKALTTALESKKEADFIGGIVDTVEYEDMTQPQGMKGKADAKKFFKEMTTGFPDAKHTIVSSWTAGDFVITEGTMTGTHKGSFFGIPATKKSVKTQQADVFQYKDGKMVKGWSYSNGADFAMQLGLMPTPGAAKAAPAAKPADTKAAPAAKPADKK